MRLYRTTTGVWAGTQADIRSACLDDAIDAKAWKEVDVPTDKPSLLDWLNWNCGRAAVRAAEAEAELDRLRDRAAETGKPITIITGGSLPSITSDDAEIWRRVTVIPATQLASPALPSVSLTDVEAFIQAADAFQLRSLFENVVLRGRELVMEAAR